MSGWRVLSGILLGCLVLSLFKIVALVFLVWVAVSMAVGVVCLVSANIQDRRALARKRFDADVKELGRGILDNMDPDVRAAHESARRDVADPAWWFDQGLIFTGATLNEGLSAAPVIKQPPRRAQASGHDADVGPRIGAAPRVPPIITDKDGRQHCAEHSIVSGGVKGAPQRIDVPTISCPTCTVLAGPYAATRPDPGPIHNGEDGRMHCRAHMVVSGGYPGTPEVVIDTPTGVCATCAFIAQRSNPIRHVAPGTE